ncbi:MAG: DUF1330 domain-containing protein [Cohaesibacteraceae bacterium]|nr:DUF1330 domain-containing protein [Cohaesibacteraceae bacterium]MBL4876290.1 DUF1330 domain-containing protein [Cohaesibacteraceae bacterium]
MSAYIISRVSIEDSKSMKSYMLAAPDSVEEFGGEYLVRTGEIEVLEGNADYDRIVVLKFPDKTQALAWYNSDSYRDLRDQRWKSATAHIVVVPGEK